MSTQRVRQTNSFAGSPCYEFSDGPPYFFGYALLGTNRSMTDHVVSDFKRRRAKGEIFFNDMTKTVRSLSAQNCGYVSLRISNKERYTCGDPWWIGKMDGSGIEVDSAGLPCGSPPQIPVVSGGDLSSLRREVSTKVLADRGKGDQNLWESLAEYKQVLDLMKNPVSELFKIASAIKEHNLRYPARKEIYSGMSGGYLKYRYGIKPLISDISFIMDKLKRVKRHDRKSSRSSGSVQQNITTTGSFGQGIATYFYQIDGRQKIDLRATSLDEALIDLPDGYGLSGKDLLTLPWELMKLSFVADWFVNVGDYINALAPAIGWNNLGSSLSQRSVTSYTYKITNVVNHYSDQFDITQPEKGVITQVIEQYSRGPLEFPGIVVKSDFRFDHATRIGDSLALAVQQLLAANTIGLRR